MDVDNDTQVHCPVVCDVKNTFLLDVIILDVIFNFRFALKNTLES